jgi:sRNA-binding protein
MSRKRATQQEILQVRAAMHLAFPACFAPKGGKKKPLKIGIRQDLMVQAREQFPTMSRRLIDNFLADYCGGHNYLKAVTKGAARVDLAGGFAGFVTQEESRYAAEKLRQIKVLKDKCRKAHLNPDIGMQQVAVAAEQSLSRAERLMKLRADLVRLETAQMASSMSDNFYVSSGRKRSDDAQIRSVKAEIASLEEQGVAA